METFDEDFENLPGNLFAQPLYLTPTWQKQMDLIGHLIQYSQNILVLTGAARSGKSSFSELFSDYKCPGVRKIVLQGKNLPDTESLMRAIAKGFHLPWPVDDQWSHKMAAEQRENQGPTWAVVIDDADSLDDETLTALLRLIEFESPVASQLRVVLIGQSDLEKKLLTEPFLPIIDDKIHVIELNDWEVEDIRMVMDEKGISDTSDQAQRIFDQTLGEPEKVLSKLQQGTVEPEIKKREPMHWTVKLIDRPVVLGVMIGVFAGVSFMVLNWDDDQSSGTHPTNVALEDTVRLPSTPPEVRQQANRPESWPKPSDLAQVEPQSAPSKVEYHSPKQTPQGHETKENPKLAQKAEASNASVQASSATQVDLSREEQTILSENSQYYTLQLVGASQANNVESFIKDRNLNSQAKLARSSLSGKNWYVVLYGSYPSLESAKKAAKEIYQDKKIKPWIRTYGSVQIDLQERLNRDQG